MRRTRRPRRFTQKTGNLRAVQLLLGHTKMDSTVRYLGVELEDAPGDLRGHRPVTAYLALLPEVGRQRWRPTSML